MEWYGSPCGLKYPFAGSFSLLYMVRNRWSYSLVPEAVSVTVTVAPAYPVADDVNVAGLTVPEAAAVIVTVCGVFQFAVVKVSVPPVVTVSPVLPPARAVVTVTLLVGTADRATV